MSVRLSRIGAAVVVVAMLGLAAWLTGSPLLLGALVGVDLLLLLLGVACIAIGVPSLCAAVWFAAGGGRNGDR